MNDRAIESQEIDKLIQNASQLHSAPQVAQSVLKLTQNSDFDIQTVLACLERDPVLTARMLRIVNSSRYGLRSPVTNLRHAVMYLGQRSIRLIAMTFSVVEIFTRGPAKQLYNDYWQQAMTMATAASRLSKLTEDVDANDAYTAGLLANLGTLIFAQFKGETYIELYRGAQNAADLVQAERSKYGFDHAAASACLLEKWEFPAELVAAIRHHHVDSTEDDPLRTIIQTADLLADVLWKPKSRAVNQLRSRLEKHYALDIDGFTDLALACKNDVAMEAEVFGIHLERQIDCQALMQEATRLYVDASIETAADLDSLTAVIDDNASR